MTRGERVTDEQIRAIEEAFERGIQAIREFAERSVTVLERAAATYAARERALAHAIMAALWRQYAEAGAPYGPTQEGLNRWLQERCVERERDDQGC